MHFMNEVKTAKKKLRTFLGVNINVVCVFLYLKFHTMTACTQALPDSASSEGESYTIIYSKVRYESLL